ncbi:hypothetical protein FHQ18_11545 [Deferribacter autotrophicus]|uniref:Uncharacterized protein n=1 Tax=Deferribacter autotrophicus TaxID=500465 RepID=A0A5A8F1C8_9BACT|nr:hypothetical protein [Deferribacter autotrophicus]KAA0257191.1 hypothetical protein FHQ18_11545 [Deferribacter autotrophicus]
MAKGSAKKVRNFFVKYKRFFYDNRRIAELLGLDVSDVRYTIRDFLKRGELEVKDGMLVYVERERRDFLLDKVWRAWRYCPVWTISEIAALTHASRETVGSYVKLYRKAGYVEKVGRKKINGVICNLYRLKNRKIRERPQILNQRKLKGVKQ